MPVSTVMGPGPESLPALPRPGIGASWISRNGPVGTAGRGRSGEVLGHEHIVHIPAVDEELVPQDAFHSEAKPLVQARGHGIGTEHAQAQLARTAGTRLLLGGGDQGRGDPRATAAGEAPRPRSPPPCNRRAPAAR